MTQTIRMGSVLTVCGCDIVFCVPREPDGEASYDGTGTGMGSGGWGEVGWVGGVKFRGESGGGRGRGRYVGGKGQPRQVSQRQSGSLEDKRRAVGDSVDSVWWAIEAKTQK